MEPDICCVYVIRMSILKKGCNGYICIEKKMYTLMHSDLFLVYF